MELKAYKKIAEIRGNMLSTIIQRCRIDHEQKDPIRNEESMEMISSPDKWDYCGILSKVDKSNLELLQYLVTPGQETIKRYK